MGEPQWEQHSPWHLSWLVAFESARESSGIALKLKAWARVRKQSPRALNHEIAKGAAYGRTIPLRIHTYVPSYI